MKKSKKIPIFIISYNRLTVLRKSIQSYLHFANYSDLIIIDKGSFYVPLMNYYLELEKKGVKIIYSNPLKTVDSLSDISYEIEKHKKSNNFDYYVVTDPDISMQEASPDVLELYTYFLDQVPDIEIVGPMLRIIDIPDNYPAREWCWKKHAQRFWHQMPRVMNWKNKKIHYQFAPIDTTFGVVRATTPYRRLLNGIRVYAPYEALHLDWYVTNETMTEDQEFYMATSNQDVAHWCSSWYKFPPTERLISQEREIFIVEHSISTDEFVIKKYRLP